MIRKILLADDDKDTVDFLKRSLEREGFEVSTAYDGLLAKEALDSNEFDLIILDLIMPEFNGWQVLRWLRHEKKLLTPTIILSAKDQIADMQKSYDLNADTYLIKPIDVSDIISAIKMLSSLGFKNN
tara:strand:- start:1849 stop:2229 length:381 start_codon:yes stop_codon:yes gene_type:complete